MASHRTSGWPLASLWEATSRGVTACSSSESEDLAEPPLWAWVASGRASEPLQPLSPFTWEMGTVTPRKGAVRIQRAHV